MAYFRININDTHFSFSAKLHNDSVIHYGFWPNNEDYDETDTEEDNDYSYIAYLTVFTLMALESYSMYSLLRNPTSVGSTFLTVSSILLDKIFTIADGEGIVLKEKKIKNTDNAKYHIYKDLNPTQELALLDFLNNKKSESLEYSIYNYNCASFVKEAFCTTYPDDCSNFAQLVKEAIYSNPDITNVITLTFLSHYDMLS